MKHIYIIFKNAEFRVSCDAIAQYIEEQVEVRKVAAKSIEEIDEFMAAVEVFRSYNESERLDWMQQYLTWNDIRQLVERVDLSTQYQLVTEWQRADLCIFDDADLKTFMLGDEVIHADGKIATVRGIGYSAVYVTSPAIKFEEWQIGDTLLHNRDIRTMIKDSDKTATNTMVKDLKTTLNLALKALRIAEKRGAVDGELQASQDFGNIIWAGVKAEDTLKQYGMLE